MNSIQKTKSAWLVRPCPHGKNRLKEFRNQNIVAIGWPCIGDLTGKSRENLKEILSNPPYNLNGLALGNAYPTIDIFVNQMQPGDLVLVANGEDIYFAEITSGYYLDQTVDNDDEGYSHQRQVRWLADTSRKRLSKALRDSLKAHRTTANLSQHVEEIRALAHGETYEPKNSNPNTIEVSYPLRPDHTITFSIPVDITENEARRLSNYFATLYFKN